MPYSLPRSTSATPASKCRAAQDFYTDPIQTDRQWWVGFKRGLLRLRQALA